MIPTTVSLNEFARIIHGIQNLTLPELASLARGLDDCDPTALSVLSSITGAPSLTATVRRRLHAVAVAAAMLRPGDRIWSHQVRGGPAGRLVRVKGVSLSGQHAVIATATQTRRYHHATPIWCCCGPVQAAPYTLRVLDGNADAPSLPTSARHLHVVRAGA